MCNIFKGAVLTVSLLVAASAMAEESAKHFAGLAAPDLETAVSNFSEYNNRLETVLNGELTDNDLMTIHQLTYTLENALEKINIDLEELAQTLEKVHVASETYNREALKEAGSAYLKTSRIIVK